MNVLNTIIIKDINEDEKMVLHNIELILLLF